MKRFLLALMTIILFGCASHAQKGMTMVGVNYCLSINTNYSKQFSGFDIKAMHNFSRFYRMQLDFGIEKISKNTDWNLELMHNIFLTRVAPVRFYFLAGCGYGKVTNMRYLSEVIVFPGEKYYDMVDPYLQLGSLTMRAGFGLDIRVLPYLSFQVEGSAFGSLCKYPRDYKFDSGAFHYYLNGSQVKIGATYNF